MASAVKQEAEQFEILEHRMTMIAVVADGGFDGFQARFRSHDACFDSPGHRPH